MTRIKTDKTTILNIESFRDSTEEIGNRFLPNLPAGDGKRQVVKTPFGCVNLYAVEIQKHHRGNNPRSLIPVYKRMILHDVKQIGRRHFKYIRVQKLPVECCAAGR